MQTDLNLHYARTEKVRFLTVVFVCFVLFGLYFAFNNLSVITS